MSPSSLAVQPIPAPHPGAQAAVAVAPRRDDPLRAVGLLMSAMILFSCSDATAKYLAATLPPIEVVWLRYLGFSLLVLPAVVAAGRPGVVLRSRRPGLQLLRGLGILGSAIIFTAALQWLPMADATATSFVSPIFITALSIPVLGESVGLRRWAAVGVGLIGVLIVVRPGSEGFQPAMLLPILSAMSWACGIVLTRKMSGADNTITTLAYSGFSGLVVMTLLVPFYWEAPSWHQVLLGLLIGLVSTTAQWIVVMAYRYADASVLAPFSYTQLVWSVLLGFLIFGAIPDTLTFLGAGIIIASGLYTAHRERVRAQQARHAG
ncbi:MAG TPA: DMT family transporter [Stellaceae bacterium]|nr:DMT family transporter [Stellaceae bacterium]